jgi:hypothetical protein
VLNFAAAQDNSALAPKAFFQDNIIILLSFRNTLFYCTHFIMSPKKETFHVVIRIPTQRPKGFVEPPSVNVVAIQVFDSTVSNTIQLI